MDDPILRIRRIGIDTFRENVAYLHRDCPVVRAAGFQALSKVSVTVRRGETRSSLLAVLNVVDDEALLAPCDLGLSEDAFARLGAAQGEAAEIAHAEPPASMAALHRKIGGERLARDEWISLMDDVAQARYSKIELAAFVVATHQNELDRDEVLYLTEAMIAAGRKLDWGH
jgi:thymidine phosphorylase